MFPMRVLTARSDLSPAVSLLTMINIKSRRKPKVITIGSLNHQLAIGSVAKPIAIPKGRLRLGGPPSLSRSFSDCRLSSRRGNVLIAAPMVIGTRAMSSGYGAKAAAIARPMLFPFSPSNCKKTGHICPITAASPASVTTGRLKPRPIPTRTGMIPLANSNSIPIVPTSLPPFRHRLICKSPFKFMPRILDSTTR